MPRWKSSIPRLFDGPEYRVVRSNNQGKRFKFEQRETITFYVEAKLKEKLRQRAHEEGVSLSELTRRIVEAWLRGEYYAEKKA